MKGYRDFVTIVSLRLVHCMVLFLLLVSKFFIDRIDCICCRLACD